MRKSIRPNDSMIIAWTSITDKCATEIIKIEKLIKKMDIQN